MELISRPTYTQITSESTASESIKLLTFAHKLVKSDVELHCNKTSCVYLVTQKMTCLCVQFEAVHTCIFKMHACSAHMHGCSRICYSVIVKAVNLPYTCHLCIFFTLYINAIIYTDAHLTYHGFGNIITRIQSHKSSQFCSI